MHSKACTMHSTWCNDGVVLSVHHCTPNACTRRCRRMRRQRNACRHCRSGTGRLICKCRWSFPVHFACSYAGSCGADAIAGAVHAAAATWVGPQKYRRTVKTSLFWKICVQALAAHGVQDARQLQGPSENIAPMFVAATVKVFEDRRKVANPGAT